MIVVDVPSATAFYDAGSYGASQFEDADITLNEIKVPLGSADLSQQINEIVKGGDTVVHIVGDPATCIAAINGLKTNGYTGPITVLNGCASEAVNTAVGENMEGVIVASPTPLGDESNSGIQLWNAILDKYAPNFGGPDRGSDHVHHRLLGACRPCSGIDGTDHHHRHDQVDDQGRSRAAAGHRCRSRLPLQRQGQPRPRRRSAPAAPSGSPSTPGQAGPALHAVRHLVRSRTDTHRPGRDNDVPVRPRRTTRGAPAHTRRGPRRSSSESS